jgi:outer membrane murein-binding lipoprotein Lpp
MADSVRAKAAHLFAPATAVRFTAGRSRADGESGENPPAGAYVDYWLRERPRGAVKLEFLDAAGAVLRTFTSADSTRPRRDSAAVAYTASDSLKRLTAYDTTGQSSQRTRIESDSVSYAPADSVVPARAGLNRFVWDLRLPGVRPVRDVVNDEGTYAGAMVVPGAYAVRLTADGRAETRPFQVVDDPRAGASQAELAATFELTRRTVDKINELADEVRRVESMQEQLQARVTQTRGQPYAARVAAAATPLRDRLEAIRAELIEVHSRTSQITLHYPVKLYNQLLNVNRMAQSFDRGPTTQSEEVYRDLAGKVDAQLGRLRALEASDLAAFNRLLKELDVPAVVAAPPAKPIS